MIGTLYEGIFQELLKNKSVEVKAIDVNKDSMRTQFVRWRGNMLADKILTFTPNSENPTRLVIKLATKQPRRQIEFTTLEPPNDPSIPSVPTIMGTDQA